MRENHCKHPEGGLPPGKYTYSNNFSDLMKKMEPKYTIPIEPVFFDHLLMNVGKTIRVVTLNGSLEGKLTEVAIDHLQLTISGAQYNIRFPHITYFVTKK